MWFMVEKCLKEEAAAMNGLQNQRFIKAIKQLIYKLFIRMISDYP